MEDNKIRYATEAALDKTNLKVEKNTQDISEVKSDVTKIFTMFENFKDLPATMNRLDKTLVGIQGQLSSMNEKINTQGDEIRAQKERGTIDWVDWVSRNWWGIVFAAATIFLIIKDYIA